MENEEIKYKNMYEHMVGALGEISWEYDAANDDIKWFGKYKELLGYDEMPETRDVWMNLIHIDNRQDTWDIINKCVISGEPWNLEYKLKKADGAYIWIHSVGFLIYDGKDKVQRIIGILRNIDNRKLTSEKLILNENRLKEAQAFAGLGSWEYCYDEKTTYWSDELYKIYGYEPGEIKASRTISLSLMCPIDKERVKKVINDVEKVGGTYEVEYGITRKDGEIRFIKSIGRVKINDKGIVYKSNGSILDITDLKEVQIKHRRSEQLYYTILSSIEEGVAVLDEDYNTIIANNWLIKILDSKEDSINNGGDLKGKNLFEICPVFDNRKTRNELQKAMNGERVDFHDQKMQLKDGRTLYFIATFTPFKLNGSIHGVLAILKDVTIYRKAKVLTELSEELNNLIQSQNIMFNKMKKQ